jgi:hypothetical protein
MSFLYSSRSNSLPLKNPFFFHLLILMAINSDISKQKILRKLPDNMALFLEQMREMGQKRNIPNISWNTAGFMIEKLRPRNISRILEI